MTIIYKKNDLITLKIGELLFKIKPLSYMERVEILSTANMQEGSVIQNAATATFLAMKYAIRGFSGAQLSDGSEYKISFDDNGNLSDESIDDLLNIQENQVLGLALNNFLKGVPSKLINPHTGAELEGVEVIQDNKGVPKK